MKTTKLLISFLLLSPMSANAYPDNFEQAKKENYNIFKKHPYTYYCGCDITWRGKKGAGTPDLSSCGYEIRKEHRRANRIEHEHIMSMWEASHKLRCWQNGGRKECRKNPEFRKMEADLHNLVPAIGEINGNRSNYQFTQWNGINGATYGSCPIQINFKERQVMPPENTRGNIARTHFYMASKYGINLSSFHRKLYAVWDNKYPVTKWECERNRLIKIIQGNDNPYISKRCYK